MKTTHDPHERPRPSRRTHPRLPTKGHRYVVTTAGSIPDDLVAIVSRTHAEALAMTDSGLDPPNGPPKPGPDQERADEEQRS